MFITLEGGMGAEWGANGFTYIQGRLNIQNGKVTAHDIKVRP